MAESESRSTKEWAAGWIEQQRELLRQQTSKSVMGEGEAARVIGEKWRSLGDSYLEGLTMLAAAAAPDSSTAAPFKVGEELLELWRNAWATFDTAQQIASRGLTDMLGRLPALGMAREHTQIWRDFAAAQAECRLLEQELRAALLQVQHEALDLLEQRTRERDISQRPIASYRELYNLWVECAEQVYSKVAHSEAYSMLQAKLGNASMRVRGHQQKVIEHALRQFDLPTRSEINSMHLQLRQMKQKIAALELPSQAVRKPKQRRATTKRSQATRTRGKSR
jgi:hypothetical protein